MNWILGIIFVYICVLLYVRFRPMPEGTSFAGPERRVPAAEIEFFYDISYWEEGERNCDQSIFHEIYRIIDGARKFLLIDMFLFTPNLSPARRGQHYLPVTRQTVDLLLRKKKENPGMPIVFITDPVNTAYGNFESDSLNRMKEAGIQVIVTDIDRLRDCNYLYGSLWFLFVKWFGIGKTGWIPHPMKDVDAKVTVRAFAKALNARANHRKTILADEGERWVTMITSANLHESSCWHSNVGVKIPGALAADCLESEKAVAEFSGSRIDYALGAEAGAAPAGSPEDVRVRLLTEKKTGDSMLEDLERAPAGTRIALCSLYLADRGFLHALVRAAKRGCEVEAVLDNNTEAFGQPKLGLPNQVTAQKLLRKSGGRIRIRMAKSRREQLHAKMIFFSRPDSFILYAGSANFTSRNLGGFTLENVVRLEGKPSDPFAGQAEIFFRKLWSGKFSYALTKKPGYYWLKAFLYNFQQVFRLTTY